MFKHDEVKYSVYNPLLTNDISPHGKLFRSSSILLEFWDLTDSTSDLHTAVLSVLLPFFYVVCHFLEVMPLKE